MDDEFYSQTARTPSDEVTGPVDDPGFLVGVTRQGETTFVLDRSVITIGSDAAADIRINGRAVAASHAKITHEDGEYHIRHLDGHAEVRVNGDTVRKSLLSDGDTVAIGEHRFTFQTGRSPKSPRQS